MRNSGSILVVCLMLAFSANAGEFSQAQLKSVFEKVAPAIGLVNYSSEITNPNTGESSKRDGNALALVVSPEGLVMCHGHMKLDNNKPFNIRVALGKGDGETDYDALYLGKPDDVNVVFLQLQSDKPLKLPYVKFAASSSLDLGQPVSMYGLLGESLDYSPGLQTGRIGAVLEKPRVTYCLDSTVRFGFVTGPVVDTQGRVVGVIGFDMTAAEGGDLYVRSGHPLVYQVELFRKYLTSPPNDDNVAEGDENAWLGVFTQPLTDDFSTYWKLDHKGGLIVSTVVPGSPAQRAGLKEGDVITSFDGTPVRAKQDRDVMAFTKLVREAGAGKESTMRVLRGGESLEIKVTLGERPRTSQDAAEYTDENLGLTVRELTQDIRIQLNLSEDVEGVIVRSVKSGSTAQLGRMQPGVIVMKIGDIPVRNLEEYKAAIAKMKEQKPKEVSVFARLGSETGFFRLEPVWE